LVPQGATRYLILAGLVLAACASTASAAPPAVTVGFTWSPHDPIVGQQIRFISTSTATSNNSIQQELWDLNGDGQFGDQAGHSVVTTFSTPGNQIVGLRVVDKHGTTHNHVHSETVIVRPFDTSHPSLHSSTFRTCPYSASRSASIRQPPMPTRQLQCRLYRRH
jgi:hypothetical protein